MDICESQDIAVDKPRHPSVPSEGNNNAAATSRRPPTREVSHRYKSPTPSVSRPCTSSSLSKTLPTTFEVLPKRAISAERRRPSTPPSPIIPSILVHDSSVDMQQLARRLSPRSRLPESLWPSTIRSLNDSFQSDSISVPVNKKEKPVSKIFSDDTLRPSSNVANKQVETHIGSRKPSPERKRSPLKGKNVQDQSENAKPIDGLHARLIDHHRWPSSLGGKASSNSMNKSVDFNDKNLKALSIPVGNGLSSLRLMSLPGVSIQPIQKSVSDAANSAEDSSLQLSGAHKLIATSLLDRLTLVIPAVRAPHFSTHGSCTPSPSRTPLSRVVSPSTPRPSTPPSGGVSPSQTRMSSVSSQPDSSSPVLRFIADFKKGKKGATSIEDAHQIRQLCNRYLQWRFANARAEAVLHVQKVNSEKILYNVLTSILDLWDSVVRKRISLQQRKLELKLNAVLNNQMAYLDDWASLERDHLNSLSGALEDLEATARLLPMTRGAKADIDSLKTAICSAVDVLQAMGSFICSLLSRVEEMNELVFELAVVVADEQAMLDECEALLASTTDLQVEEYSIRTDLIQLKYALENQRILATTTPPWPDQLQANVYRLSLDKR